MLIDKNEIYLVQCNKNYDYMVGVYNENDEFYDSYKWQSEKSDFTKEMLGKDLITFMVDIVTENKENIYQLSLSNHKLIVKQNWGYTDYQTIEIKFYEKEKQK